MYICIIIIILLIISILSLIFYNKKKFENQEKHYYNKQQQREQELYNTLQQKVQQEFINQRRQELEEKLLIESAEAKEKALLRHREFLAKLREEQQQLEGIIRTGEETIRQLEIRKKEQTKLIEEAVSDKKKIVDTEIAAYKEVEMQKAATAITQWAATARSEEQASLNIYKGDVAQSKSKMQEELARIQQDIDAVKTELSDYKKKQEAVNEAILRQRELEEKQDFYRVCLSNDIIEDISLLQEIRQKLHISDSLNKLIYDVYVSKSVQEMVKRVLQGGAPSGIYKITRMKTGEIYIGKSSDVRNRWQQHCKTVFGAGTIAHSILHTTMQKDGLQNFTFELVEEVPKEKLTEREKYWIDFYGSKKYGLNEKNG